jgi:hypothetical protein
MTAIETRDENIGCDESMRDIYQDGGGSVMRRGVAGVACNDVMLRRVATDQGI